MARASDAGMIGLIILLIGIAIMVFGALQIRKANKLAEDSKPGGNTHAMAGAILLVAGLICLVMGITQARWLFDPYGYAQSHAREFHMWRD